MTKRISIITAVFNNEEFIRNAAESVLEQTGHDLELEYIVIDGGSSDQTLNILYDFKDRITHLITEPDRGIYDALNKGIDKAQGDYIGFLHSDDEFSDRFVLQNICYAFAQDSKIDGVYGDLQYVSREDKEHIIRHWQSQIFNLKDLKQGWMPPHPTLFLRREIYQKYGGFDLTYKIAADYDFMMRILHKGEVNIKYLSQVITKMRVGGSSNTIRNLRKKSMEDLRIMKKYGIGGKRTLLAKNFRKIPQFFKKQ
jgi:glycosyltransferase